MTVYWLPFSNIVFESFNVIYIFMSLGTMSQTLAAMDLREVIPKCSEIIYDLVKSIRDLKL